MKSPATTRPATPPPAASPLARNAPQRVPERPSSRASTSSRSSLSSQNSVVPFPCKRSLEPRTLPPLQAPSPKRESSYLFGASAVAMMVTGLLVLKPGFALSEDAPEHPSRTPRQSKEEIEARERQICIDFARAKRAPQVLIHPHINDRRYKLIEGFDLIFGSGFGGWLPFLGVLRALESENLMGYCTGLYGVSAGALTLALYRCLGVQGAGRELLNFGAARFLDLSLWTLLTERAVCEGRAIERAVRGSTAPSRYKRLEQISRMPLHIGVFDGERGRTIWPERGDIAQLVAHSCALPGLFPQRKFSDGGLVDHHGTTALRNDVLSFSVRLPTKLERTFEQRWVGRPEPLFNVSARPEHVQMQLVTSEKVSLITMLKDLDYDKAKLVRIVNEAEVLTKWYLRQPYYV